ncbi:hypothetical protein CYG48_18645 (plasmid) [Neorhizobium sp. SOG26]|nr:hypothetical protein CYG48_18645 [Neorhizobium sp. SOG26]
MEKLDPLIYDHVISEERVDPLKILFADDTPRNIDAANQRGWALCIHHVSVRDTVAKIERLVDNQVGYERPFVCSPFSGNR